MANDKLQDALLDEIEGLTSPDEASDSSEQKKADWDAEAIKAFQEGQLDAPKERPSVLSQEQPDVLDEPDESVDEAPADALASEANLAESSPAQELSEELTSLSDIEDNLAQNAAKRQTAQQMQRMVESKPLIDAIMAAHEAARVAEEAAETSLSSTKLVVDRFNEQEEDSRRRDTQTLRHMREMDFRIQQQSGRSAWAARLAVVNFVLILVLLGGGGMAFWWVTQSPVMFAQSTTQPVDEMAVANQDLQRATLDAVLEINNSLRNFEKNLQGLQTQWLAVKETQTPGEASVVPTVNAGLMADFASLERDIRFVKTNLVSIKQHLLGSDASKEILRLRESLELLKSELVGIKIQEQKVAAKVNPSEAGPYKYVVPPNLNPY